MGAALLLLEGQAVVALEYFLLLGVYLTCLLALKDELLTCWGILTLKNFIKFVLQLDHFLLKFFLRKYQFESVQLTMKSEA